MPKAKLILPEKGDGPRVRPREFHNVNHNMKAEYEKARWTWGIHNNLMKTMAAMPQLGFTEVDYANSFIFDEGTNIDWPDPADSNKMVQFPTAGFVDRITKELVINLLSLLNRSRYSITHHTIIGFGTLSAMLDSTGDSDPNRKAEELMLNLVDGQGNATYRNTKGLYSEFQLACLDFAVKARENAHEVSDHDVIALRKVFEAPALEAIKKKGLDYQFKENKPTEEYVNMYLDAMFIELTWNICHFNGLLNNWFTLLKMHDEQGRPNGLEDDLPDGIYYPDFVANYNQFVPESIIIRNNELLKPSGFGR